MRKILTRLCGTNFCTSSAHFAPSFARQPNVPECTQMVQNTPKRQFRVQWSGLGALIEKNYFLTSWHELLPQKLKGKFYRTAIHPAMLYGAECWPTKRWHVQQLSVAEMRMLRWLCGHTRRDRVRDEDIRDRVGVAPIEEKLIQHRLRWFGHVQRRPPKAPVRSGVLKKVDNVKRGRC